MSEHLPSLKLTQPLKINGWKMNFLLGWPIFRGYVKPWGGIWGNGFLIDVQDRRIVACKSAWTATGTHNATSTLYILASVSFLFIFEYHNFSGQYINIIKIIYSYCVTKNSETFPCILLISRNPANHLGLPPQKRCWWHPCVCHQGAGANVAVLSTSRQCEREDALGTGAR